ncbi:MAG TPA: hypothetical protein VFW39_04935 [Sphingomicrobium sp.]|nr:hypothetical protein [Sphingomicrobium sp.]
MSKSLRAAVRVSGLALFGFGAMSFASGAMACGETALGHPASWQSDQGGGSLFHRADATILGVHTIVGMWSFRQTVGGQLADFGFQQWHSDGTEFMNSGTRAPATQNFCLGVWSEPTAGHYHLNHLAISYDSSGVHNANVTITEDVALAATGMSYAGTFSIDVRDPNTNALLQHVAGRVTAQRILP